jgi:pilus assembly protein Flp/PilA
MMQYVAMMLESFRDREDEGQGLVEYGLIIALVAVVCVVALTALGTGVSGVLTGITGSL